MLHYPLQITKLIEMFKQLPGVGSKTGERYAFEMLSWSPQQLQDMGQLVGMLSTHVQACEQCGCLKHEENCPFCNDARRNQSVICVIASPRDAYTIEKTREYRGLYHILGGLLSPIDGHFPDQLELPKLLKRIQQDQVRELVIALDSTLEGDATALYLKQELGPLNLQISRLAFGLPMGSSLDYVDGDTLARALSGRRPF